MDEKQLQALAGTSPSTHRDSVITESPHGLSGLENI